MNIHQYLYRYMLRGFLLVKGHDVIIFCLSEFVMFYAMFTVYTFTYF